MDVKIACLRLTADPDKIDRAIQQKFGSDVVIHTISRTDLTGVSPFRAFRKIQTLPGDAFCIACKTLQKRPRLSILKATLLLCGKRQAYLIDEDGHTISKSWPAFILVDLPKITWELIVSIWVVISWTIILMFLKVWLRE